MLSVGTGAQGSTQNPDVADYRQRRLQTPLHRKGFTSVIYRKPDGAISTVPSNIVDFTTTFESQDAVGALNEMGLMSTSSGVEGNNAQFNPVQENNVDVVFPSRDTTVNIKDYDILVNYLTFPVINKPNGAVLSITWRLTF